MTWSPDDRVLVTAMQESALHGWCLSDKADIGMAGYPAKAKSWAWIGATPWLATCGADDAVLWPFDGPHGPHGPMSRAPTMLWHPPRGPQVTAVAAMPGREAALAGFADGRVTPTRIDRAEEPRLVLLPSGAPVLAIAVVAGWLLASREDGGTYRAPFALEAR